MATAIASLVRGLPVSAEVGLTGEITLTGQVLGIGGVREKVLAAQRAGLKRVILPSENEPDLDELPADTRRELEFVLVDSIDQVFEVAFNGSVAHPVRNVAKSRAHAPSVSVEPGASHSS
jgi:ATP-dependent Lon protease